MSIDHRTRLSKDLRDIPRDEIFDVILPEAIERNGLPSVLGERLRLGK